MEPRRSIQDIIPPTRSKPIRVSVPDTTGTTPPPPPPQPPKPPTPPPSAPRMPMKGTPPPLALYAGIGLFALVMGIAVILAMSTIFHRAYITVTPTSFEIPLSTSFPSSPDDPTLPYQRVSAEETVSKVVAATGKEKVSERASGTLIVYNALSEKSQRLITNTRFQSPEGRIYRASNPIVIPGYTMKGGVKVPGSIEVTVYASDPGDSYNAGLVDFILPGLSVADQKLIYAKSKTPISGGFVGDRAVVDPAVRAGAISDLEAEVTRTLATKLKEITPSGSIIFGETVSVVMSKVPDTLKDERNATVSVIGTATAPAFSLDILAHVFAETGGIIFDGPLTIENPNDLIVSVDAPGAATLGTPLTISVSGTVRLIATLNREMLSNDLAGKKESDIAAVRVAYPGIETMDVKVYPFWSSEIPKDSSKVKVEVVDPVEQNAVGR